MKRLVPFLLFSCFSIALYAQESLHFNPRYKSFILPEEGLIRPYHLENKRKFNQPSPTPKMDPKVHYKLRVAYSMTSAPIRVVNPKTDIKLPMKIQNPETK